MKNKSICLLAICSVLLAGCNKSVTRTLDDIDFVHYVHHVNHYILDYVRKINVTIKNLGSSDVKTYTFEDLVYSDDYYWTSTVPCEEYVNDGCPLGYVFEDTAILKDDLASGFINNQYWDVVSAIDYYGDNREERQEESFYNGRVARLRDSELTFITQWNVISYTGKHEISEGDGELITIEYDDPKGLFCVSKSIYNGEQLSSYTLYLTNKLYMRDDDCNGATEFHKEVFDEPIDYLSYQISF